MLTSDADSIVIVAQTVGLNRHAETPAQEPSGLASGTACPRVLIAVADLASLSLRIIDKWSSTTKTGLPIVRRTPNNLAFIVFWVESLLAAASSLCIIDTAFLSNSAGSIKEEIFFDTLGANSVTVDPIVG